MKLSILICTIPERQKSFDELMEELYYQKQGLDVEVLFNPFKGTIGEKRNDLLRDSTGEYVCFVDDDDMVSKDYVKDLLEGCATGKDCMSLRGVITWDGKNPEIFEHSIKYSQYKTTANPIKYERFPNHLNCIKSFIAKCIKFPEINHGEDTEWACTLSSSGLIKSEHYIDKVLYNYKFKPNK